MPDELVTVLWVIGVVVGCIIILALLAYCCRGRAICGNLCSGLCSGLCNCCGLCGGKKKRAPVIAAAERKAPVVEGQVVPQHVHNAPTPHPPFHATPPMTIPHITIHNTLCRDSSTDTDTDTDNDNDEERAAAPSKRHDRRSRKHRHSRQSYRYDRLRDQEARLNV